MLLNLLTPACSLTYIEPTQPEYQQALVKSGDVVFRGTLTIEKGRIKWLTERGQRMLERELRKRDVQARQRSSVDNVGPSSLRLRDALAVGKLKIWVQGIKSTPAVFERSENYIHSGRALSNKG